MAKIIKQKMGRVSNYIHVNDIALAHIKYAILKTSKIICYQFGNEERQVYLN